MHFAIFNFVVTIWSLFYGFYIISGVEEVALIHARLAMFFIVLIPYCFFNTACKMSDFKLSNNLQKINNIVVIIILMLMLTPFMVKGVKPYLGFKFIPDISLVFYIYHIYYLVMVISGLTLLKKSIQNNYKNKLFFTGFTIGFIGGTTNLVPYSGIPLYPLANFLISAYCLVIAYALTKYRIPDKRFAMNMIIKKIIAFLIIIFSYILISEVYKKLVITDNKWMFFLFNILCIVSFFELYQVIVKKLFVINDNFGFKIPYRIKGITEDINNKIFNIIDIEKLSNSLKSILENKMELRIKAFYISIKINNSNSISKNNKILVRIFGEDIDINYLRDLEKMLEMSGKLYRSSKYNEVNLKTRDIMDKIGCKAIIPFVFHREINGFLILKSRKNKKDFFFYEDMEIFDDLVFKVGVAIERIGLNQDKIEQERIVHEEKAKILKSLSGSIAHEVRNPLNAINLLSLQINDSVDELSNLDESKLNNSSYLVQRINKLKQEVNKNISLIKNTTKRANDVINMTLNDISGQKINENDFTMLSAYKLIINALEEYGYQDNQEKKKVFFISSNKKNDFYFKGDETLFIYILFNLLKNALYYQNKRENFRIEISTKINKENNVVEIMDNGIGIPSDKLEKIFGNFGTFGKKEGTGLGLPFCRRVMESFGGTITCESILGKYTKFILRFPKINKKKPNQNNNKPKLETKNILIADDQEINLIIAEKVLRNNFGNICNLNIDLVKNGKEAVDIVNQKENRKAKNDYYNLIIMDQQMPIMDGAEASKRIREFSKTIPIITVTSRRAKEVMESSIRSGVDSYITKPIPNLSFLYNTHKWMTSNKYRIESNNGITKEDLIKALKGKRVIIADDQVINYTMMKRILSKYELIVDTANDGDELIEKFTKNNLEEQEDSKSYDIIITDINMKRVSGIEATKKIRQLENTYYATYENVTELPTIIIAYSGDSGEDLTHNFLQVGMNDYFIKSNDPENLLRIIYYYLAVRSRYFGNLEDIKNIENTQDNISYKEIPNKEKNKKKDKDISYEEYPILLKNKYYDEIEIKEIVKIFIEEAKKNIEKIEISYKEKNIERLHFYSHALKGISGNIGAKKLYHFIKIINNYSIQNKLPPKKINNNYKDWLEELKNMVEEIGKSI